LIHYQLLKEELTTKQYLDIEHLELQSPRYLCSLMAIDKRNTNFGTTAICFLDASTKVVVSTTAQQGFSFRVSCVKKKQAECLCTCEKLVQHSQPLPQALCLSV